jgi:hypothetical protein
VSQHAVEGPRHSFKIQRPDELGSRLDLPAALGAEEAPELFLVAPSSPGGLVLEGAERVEFTLCLEHLFHGGGAERADQLILQVCLADVETESFHAGPSEVGAEAGPLEATLEVALLARVAESSKSHVEAPGTKTIQEASDVPGSPDGHDGNALGFEVPASAPGQGFEGELVADPFDKHRRLA